LKAAAENSFERKKIYLDSEPRKPIEFYKATAKNKTRTNQKHKPKNAERNSSQKPQSKTSAEKLAQNAANQGFPATAAGLFSPHFTSHF